MKISVFGEDCNNILHYLPPRKGRYEKSSISQRQVLELFIEVDSWMRCQKAYLQVDLELKDIARQFCTNTTYASQAINEVSGYNVSQYINSLRIEEFLVVLKREGSSCQNFAMLAHACGFRSFSTFSRSFRRFIGCNPTAYLKTIQRTQDMVRS